LWTWKKITSESSREPPDVEVKIMIKETWKSVVGYEGKYEVSNLGKVKSVSRTRSGRKNLQGKHCEVQVVERNLRQKADKDGYLSVVLFSGGVPKNLKVHRLVAQAFIANPQELPVVHHKDECVTNNRASNLQWVTTRENLYASNVFGKLAAIHSSPIFHMDRGGNLLATYRSRQEASRATGIDVRHISAVVNGNRTHTRGNVFKEAVTSCD
jgi:hypothetical protein